jgi:mono/diheme cytochrome c family protein
MPTPGGGSLTYQATIGPLFQTKCAVCHGTGGGQKELDLTSYAGVLKGGASGPAIVPSDPQGSLLVQKQSGEQPHFSQLSADELALIMDWIAAGAPEN